MDADSPRLRLSILGIVVFGLFATLFARLYYLQVMSPESGQVEAANNRIRVIQEEAPRGRILDAKGRVIVDNRTSLVVTMDPQQLKELDDDERDGVVERLAHELTVSGTPTKVTSIERHLTDPQYSPIQPIPVAIDVSDDLMIYLAEHADEFPSVAVHRESVRSYPHKTLAAQVVGYVGRISGTELESKMGTKDDPKTIPKPYQPDSDIGKDGIERTFEDDLRGTPGIKTVEIDSDGKVVRQVGYQKPIPGNDVQLTIDLDVQEVTETKLAAQLAEARNTYTTDYKLARAPAGSAVVLDPNNGSVVAMASYPTYDPSEFVNGISTDRYAQFQEDPATNPLINRAIGGLYAPGSTFKIVTATAGLKAGIITPTSPVYDNGSIEIGPQRFQNAGGVSHGSVQLASSLTVSSDVYYYLIGAQFWNGRDQYGDGIQNTARDFGFGAPTGIQLPGELGGVIPDPAWKRQLFEAMTPEEQANGDPNWYTGNSVILAIGQGDMLATPLQMANSYSSLVDGGVVRHPNLVLRVLKPGAVPVDVDPATLGKDGCDPAADDCPIVRTVDAGIIHQFDLPASISSPIIQGLEGVTKDANGTAYNLFRDFDQSSWPVMGKTGTAEVKGKADNSLFVGVGPSDHPQYVAAVVLEEAGFGAEVAGPVVKTIFEHLSGQAEQCDPAATEGVTTTTVPVVSDADIIETDDCALPTPDGGVTTADGTIPSTGTADTTATTTPTYDPSQTGGVTTTTVYVPPTTAYVPPTTAYDPTLTTPTTPYATTTVPTTPSTTGTGTTESTPATTAASIAAGPAIPVVGLSALAVDGRRRRRSRRGRGRAGRAAERGERDRPSRRPGGPSRWP